MPLQVLNLTIFIFTFCFLSTEAKPVIPAIASEPDEDVKPVEPVRPVEPVKPKKPAGAVSMFGGVDLFGASKSPPSSAVAAKAHVTTKPKGENVKHVTYSFELIVGLVTACIGLYFKKKRLLFNFQAKRLPSYCLSLWLENVCHV